MKEKTDELRERLMKLQVYFNSEGYKDAFTELYKVIDGIDSTYIGMDKIITELERKRFGDILECFFMAQELKEKMKKG
jgi:hypothetical protein